MGSGKGSSPMNTRKYAKLALNAGTARPAGLPGFPIEAAWAFGFVTYAP